MSLSSLDVRWQVRETLVHRSKKTGSIAWNPPSDQSATFFLMNVNSFLGAISSFRSTPSPSPKGTPTVLTLAANLALVDNPDDVLKETPLPRAPPTYRDATARSPSLVQRITFQSCVHGPSTLGPLPLFKLGLKQQHNAKLSHPPTWVSRANPSAIVDQAKSQVQAEHRGPLGREERRGGGSHGGGC